MGEMDTRRKYQVYPEWQKSRFPRVEREETFNNQQIFIERLLCARHCSKTPYPQKKKKMRGRKCKF